MEFPFLLDFKNARIPFQGLSSHFRQMVSNEETSLETSSHAQLPVGEPDCHVSLQLTSKGREHLGRDTTYGQSAQHLIRQPIPSSCYLLNAHSLTRSELSDLVCPVGSAALWEPSLFKLECRSVNLHDLDTNHLQVSSRVPRKKPSLWRDIQDGIWDGPSE